MLAQAWPSRVDKAGRPFEKWIGRPARLARVRLEHFPVVPQHVPDIRRQ